MTAYVLDASVAAKWYLEAGETLVPEALAIRTGFVHGTLQLSVPDLFWPELSNILWKAVRRGRISGGAADAAVQALAGLRLATTPGQGLMKDAYSIATVFQCTVYDATYVALAVTSQRPMLTADERLANLLAVHLPVKWLGAI